MRVSMFEVKEAPAAGDMELKFLEGWGDSFEIKYSAAEDDSEGTIEGYASIFGERDRIDDIVLPGAFSKSLRAKKSTRLPMLVGHVQRIPVGVWLSMAEDNKGLKVKGWLDLQSADGSQLHRVAKKGAELGISIGYRTIDFEYIADPKTGAQVRLLKEVDLYECSLVTIPCCDGARVTQVKSIQSETPEQTVERAAVAYAQKQLVEFHAGLAIAAACQELRGVRPLIEEK